MNAVGPFCQPVNQVAAFWAIHAQERCVFIAQDNGNQPLAVFVTVIIQIADDLLFQRIFVSWLDNTVFIAALEVNPDVIAAGSNSAGVGPVNLLSQIAIFVFKETGVAQVIHQFSIDAERIAKGRKFFLLNQQAVV